MSGRPSHCTRRIAQAARRATALACAFALAGCTVLRVSPPTQVQPSNVNADAVLTPGTRFTLDLTRLPPPRHRVPVAVYAFRDQTGQFKAQPDSNLSNMVTQGAASILVKALLDSGWYLPVEREGFQNLLNERRVARALEVPSDRGRAGASYPTLIPASFILEGGIVGYETNVRTGGVGANLLGIGAETKYRIDQVTVALRSVDVRTGQVANGVSVTKTIYSHEVSSSVYRFISYKTLLQAEGGYSTNEPSQLAVKEAIEAAVIHLTLQGVSQRVWSLRTDADWELPLVQTYMRESSLHLADPRTVTQAQAPLEPVPLREPVLVRPAGTPIHMQQVAPSEQPPAAPAHGTAPRPDAPAPPRPPVRAPLNPDKPVVPPAQADAARPVVDAEAGQRARAAEQARAEQARVEQARAREQARAAEAAARAAAAVPPVIAPPLSVLAPPERVIPDEQPDLDEIIVVVGPGARAAA